MEAKQQWITPELVEYGDVTKLTEGTGKGYGTWDGIAIQDQEQDWASGCAPQ